MSEYVEVVDFDVLTVTGLRSHTIRPHEGDVVKQAENGDILIRKGPREVTVGNEKRSLPGQDITLVADKIVEISRQTRFEPRVRPSLVAIANREKAELDSLKQKLGVTS